MKDTYEGLYVKYHADNSNEWLERKHKLNQGKKMSYSSIDISASTNTTNTTSASKLTISSKLKAVMVVNFQST